MLEVEVEELNRKFSVRFSIGFCWLFFLSPVIIILIKLVFCIVAVLQHLFFFSASSLLFHIPWTHFHVNECALNLNYF